MASDEVVIVERMYESAVEAWECMGLGSLPGFRVGHRNDGRAQRPHPVKLGLRSGFDRDDRAWNSSSARGIGNALPGIAGADRPDALRLILVRQIGNRIRSAADL